jgi:hypothetical protein
MSEKKRHEGKICAWYSSGGALVTMEPAAGVTSDRLSAESASFYKGSYLIAESMSQSAAKAIAESLGLAYMGCIHEKDQLDLPTGFEIVHMVADRWHLTLLAALMLIDNLDMSHLSKVVEAKTEAARLRASADRVRDSAQRADDPSARDRDMRFALELDQKAAELEKVA